MNSLPAEWSSTWSAASVWKKRYDADRGAECTCARWSLLSSSWRWETGDALGDVNGVDVVAVYELIERLADEVEKVGASLVVERARRRRLLLLEEALEALDRLRTRAEAGPRLAQVIAQHGQLGLGQVRHRIALAVRRHDGPLVQVDEQREVGWKRVWELAATARSLQCSAAAAVSPGTCTRADRTWPRRPWCSWWARCSRSTGREACSRARWAWTPWCTCRRRAARSVSATDSRRAGSSCGPATRTASAARSTKCRSVCVCA